MKRMWYAVHTYSGHENKVKDSIERRASSMGLREKIGDVLIPTEPETRMRAGKKIETKRKVFPGYVLIEMFLDDSTWYLVKSTTGVTGFIPPGSKPVPLLEKEIRELLQSAEAPAPVIVVKFAKDEVVRVTAGPFTEFTGKIEMVIPEKEKLRVLISIFGRDTPVELDFNQVEKVI